MSPKTIACDFDGTLCTIAFPEIGIIEEKHQRVINYIRKNKELGGVNVLWTCREDLPERAYLTEAVNWCKEQNIPIDYVNEYCQEEFLSYKHLLRKVSADEYIDDKGINVNDIQDINNISQTQTNKKPAIITFSGSARCGKGAASKISKEILAANNKRVLEINFADYVKFITALYQDQPIDKSPEDLAKGIFNRTDETRTKWQIIGTEKVRDRFPDFWVDSVINIAKIFNDDYDYILISDLRFPNEYTRCIEERYNIVTVHVERQGFDNDLSEKQKAHRSETSLDDFNFDIYLSAKNIEELENEVKLKIVQRLLNIKG